MKALFSPQNSPQNSCKVFLFVRDLVVTSMVTARKNKLYCLFAKTIIPKTQQKNKKPFLSLTTDCEPCTFNSQALIKIDYDRRVKQ